MRKRWRYFLLVTGLLLILPMTHCGDEEDIALVCAGCPDDAPWSVVNSSECYETFEDCDASERGDCTVCD